VKYTANDAEIDMNEQVSIWEGIYEPLIENEDVHNLVLWDPGRQCMLYDHRAPEANSHYFQLLERIATVLETRKGDREVAKALSDVRDCQAKIRRLFPELDLPQKPPDVPVTMLLTKSDWPEKRAIGGHLILPRLEENMLWLAFMGPPYNWQASVGLAGIDLKEKRLCALWQTKISFTRYPGVSGMVITKEACYLSVRGAGLLLLPGSAAEGREHFSNPKVLTQEHGLPSVLVTSLTKDGNRLWIAYGDRGQESGLGLYDPHTGYWETVLCSTLDGEPPFNAGQPYVLRKLTPVPPDRLFFLVCDPEYSRPTKMRQWTGVWRMNTNTQELKYLGVGSVEGPAPQGVLIADLGGKWLFGGRDSLTEFDLASERTRLVSAEEYLGVRNPKIGMGTSYAGETWARLGDSQIIIVQQGKSLEEATIIENNILDGGKVFEFLSTPYGLIAIGDGTVGLIETESDEK
jgi:hypothetical protein